MTLGGNDDWGYFSRVLVGRFLRMWLVNLLILFVLKIEA